VNRGLYGVETASLLLALKVAFPERIHLLRGSHETRQITQLYGFIDECLRKYGGVGGEEVWQAFMNSFDALPLAAIINDKTLCLHSGLSPSLDTIAQIEELDRYAFITLLLEYSCACACACACAADSLQPCVGRFQETPPEGPLTDLAWSQPEDIEGWQLCPRSAGFIFGSGTVAYVDATPQFGVPRSASSWRSRKRTRTKQISLCCAAVTGDWLDKNGLELLVTTSSLVMEVRC
jgi:diadenosine tetraphosphatase ApaH/serine/threonine PP2A family protein phosphatase